MTCKIQTSFNSQHSDLIHDVRIDYYGKYIATCSSDHTVNIFRITDGQKEEFVSQLDGHTGPVWQVSWSHPRFGLLASCSYDGSVVIWKQEQERWSKVKTYKEHTGSVNSVSFYQSKTELILACGSSDGRISFLSFDEKNISWKQTILFGHENGVNSVCWFDSEEKRIVSGGCDGLIKFWKEDKGEWVPDGSPISVHSDWVCDVSCAPKEIFDCETVASCGHDKKVFILKKDGNSWHTQELPHTFKDTVWRVSWSLARSILGVCCESGSISFWKETEEGWNCVSETGNVLEKNFEKETNKQSLMF